MKKYFYIIAALSIAPTFALAQSFDSEVDTELDQIAAQQVAPRQQPVMPAQQPIYILNQGAPNSANATSSSNSLASQNQGQLQGQQQVQKQPTTLIESTPLTESRAEQIRKARQDAELQTEQKIVEKLEVSRMEDEKRRANNLFGDRFQPAHEAPPVVVQQPVYVQPAPVQVVQDNHDVVREEVRMAHKAEAEAADVVLSTNYFGAMVGIGEYPDVRNVTGNYAFGAQFGTKSDGFIVEGTFMYSNYNVDQVTQVGMGYSCSTCYMVGKVDVNQYSGSIAGKYEFFNGMVRPVIGGLMAFSYRTFSWAQTGGYNYGGYGSDTAASQAIDLGVITGLDLVFTPKFSLGLDFRYMFNLASRVSTNNNNGYWANAGQIGTPIEKLQYYVVSVVGRVNF